MISKRTVTNLLSCCGRILFSFAIMALGSETVICAHSAADSLGPEYKVIPVLPWLPAISWFAYIFGAILAVCGAAILVKRVARSASLVLGSCLFLGALTLDLPKYAVHFGNMSLRTTVFEPLALAALAWLLGGRVASPGWLLRGSRYLLGLSLVVFGVDHLIGLLPIAALIPAWIPWHVFWIGFFGAGFCAAGLSISFNLLPTWGAGCLGLMFAIWVITLHLPRVLGVYGIPGAPQNPNEWESLLIAVALWGGPWALIEGAGREEQLT